MDKKNILLLFGGESSEHDVSIIGARNVFAALDANKYEVTLCYISKVGQWFLLDSIDQPYEDKPQLQPVMGAGMLSVIGEDKLIKPDVVFPLLHGKNGEDGTMQGLLDLLHLPYVGPSALGAAVTMNKDMTKRLARDAGVPVVPWHVWRTGDQVPAYEQMKSELGDVMFVKPSRAGSSMGVSRVESVNQWQQAVELAAQHDTEVIIEKAVVGNEFQIAVLGTDKPRATDICEIVIGATFHDFEDKYNENSTAQFYIPARLGQGKTDQLREWALLSYDVTGCRGMARVDFLADSDGAIYLNEINGIPGFTNVSVYPKLWSAAGVEYSQLIEELISIALNKAV